MMTMLVGYGHMKRFFTTFDWWRLEPRDDLAGGDTLVLAEPGRRYVAYTPKGGRANWKLASGSYQSRWYNPRDGAWSNPFEVKQASDGLWTSPVPEDVGDWALLLEAR